MSEIEKRSSLDKSALDIAPASVEKGIVSPIGADAALDFLQQRLGEDGAPVEVNEKSLLRKIDFRIVPLMWCCYFLQYLDKVGLPSSTALRSADNQDSHQLCQCHGSTARHAHNSLAVLLSRLGLLCQLSVLRADSCLPHATISNRKVSRTDGHIVGNLRYDALRM